MRESGILMPVSSLPGPYGIGCFGKEAFKFVDFLAQAGQKIWQILPLSPTGYGDSPYQSCSAFAGNPYFIDLDALKEEGLLTAAQLKAEKWGTDPKEVDYGTLYVSRFKVLRAAYAASRNLHDRQAKRRYDKIYGSQSRSDCRNAIRARGGIGRHDGFR